MSSSDSPLHNRAVSCYESDLKRELRHVRLDWLVAHEKVRSVYSIDHKDGIDVAASKASE